MLVLTDAQIARMDAESGGYGLIERGALVISGANAAGSQSGGVHASLLVNSETGLSAVMPAPAPAGVAYRDIRLG